MLKYQHDLTVTVRTDNGETAYPAQRGDSLLDILRGYGYSIPAPCGGCGTCKACLVIVQGVGTVVSCRYFLRESCVVQLAQPLPQAAAQD